MAQNNSQDIKVINHMDENGTLTPIPWNKQLHMSDRLQIFLSKGGPQCASNIAWRLVPSIWPRSGRQIRLERSHQSNHLPLTGPSRQPFQGLAASTYVLNYVLYMYLTQVGQSDFHGGDG